MLMDFSSCPKNKNCMRRGYSNTCAESTLFLTEYGGLKWEGWVRCSGRKDKNIILVALGRFYSTFVIVVLNDTLPMEGKMSEFSACAPGDRYGNGRRGRFKRCLYVCRGTQAPKLLVAAMVTTFRIKWKYEITFPLLLTYLLFLWHVSSQQGQTCLGASQPGCFALSASSWVPALQPRCLLRGFSQPSGSISTCVPLILLQWNHHTMTCPFLAWIFLGNASAKPVLSFQTAQLWSFKKLKGGKEGILRL